MEASIEMTGTAVCNLEDAGNEEKGESPSIERTIALVELEFVYRKFQNGLCNSEAVVQAVNDVFR